MAFLIGRIFVRRQWLGRRQQDADLPDAALADLCRAISPARPSHINCRVIYLMITPPLRPPKQAMSESQAALMQS